MEGRPSSVCSDIAVPPTIWAIALVRTLLLGQCRDGGFGVHPYRKWAGAHWRLVSLVELGIPAGEQRALRAADTVLDCLPFDGGQGVVADPRGPSHGGVEHPGQVLHGTAAVSAYWLGQFSVANPRVEPVLSRGRRRPRRGGPATGLRPERRRDDRTGDRLSPVLVRRHPGATDGSCTSTAPGALVAN